LSERIAGNDRHDIQACLEGDEEAYARMVRRYETQVAAQMWRFTRDRDVLDELVQDVFVEVYLSLAKYRARAPFLHWVRRIATRVGYRYWKRQARDRRRQAAMAKWHADLPGETVEPTPSEAAEYLHRLLEQLPPRDRLVLTLHYFEAFSTREIAERTGWSRALVKVRAYRARKKLKALLTEAGFGRKDDV
jgi:RNA polymerase sigma-70 factor (ECF subfamily)